MTKADSGSSSCGASTASATARRLLFVLSPVLVLGVVLTISLFGAIAGIPLLLLTVPPSLMALRSLRGRSVPPRRLLAAYLPILVVETLAAGGVAVFGFDDAFDAVNVAPILLGVLWLAASWYVALALWGATQSEPNP